MSEVGWLTHRQADVPDGDGWLTISERAVLGRLQLPARRAAWRLGRWTAKAAVGLWLGLAPESIEVRAAGDGAPEAWYHGRRLPVSVSLSHRAGRGLAVVAATPEVVGCDLERLEFRSDAFVRGWLSAGEQAAVRSAGPAARPLMANLIWSAKEASAKVRRAGLRLPVQRAVVAVAPAARADAWRPLTVDWQDGTPPMPGWWRREPAWVMVVAGAGEITPARHRLQ